MSEQQPEAGSVTIELPPPARGDDPGAEETALAAGAALSLSGEARAEASEASQMAAAAATDASEARAEADAAAAEANTAAAVSASTDTRLDRLMEMMSPIYDDFAARKAAESEQATPEVNEIDATGSSAGGTAGTGTGDNVPGPDSGTTSESPAGSTRRTSGLRRFRR